MARNKSLGDYFKEFEKDPIFVSEGMAVNIAQSAHRIMISKGMSFSDLAENMGVSRPYISKIFNGKPNMTIETLAKLANALDVNLKAPEFVIYEQYDILDNYEENISFENIKLTMDEIDSEENHEHNFANAA